MNTKALSRLAVNTATALTRFLPPPALSEPIANIDLLCLPNMAAEAFGIAAGAIGLAATVFQTAKGTRDIIHTVGSSI